ncbi:putative cyclase [Rippkaea orientalis PCC 8801]|uniref:Putative cyclase n=1 Tax=Rippkaea orientalis (strain PCC 8801 / RF-1) TaxID=41431 RepID=B7JVE3_RIPO1|nr:cyclase family protein [Rippkaea orientalis]ACK68276.1 putative cyclase [Rippkaea orientalis PCC 8801]
MLRTPYYKIIILMVCMLLILVGFPAPSHANDLPLKQRWNPSSFGQNDQVGSVNWITDKKVLDSLKLVKKGKVTTLGKVYQTDSPFVGERNWKLIIPGVPTGGPIGQNEIVYNDEYVMAELGQVGTQFDGLGHVGVKTSKGNYFYNGNFLEEFGTSYGLTKLGVEKIGQIGYVTRGVLLDIAGYRGIDRLPIPQGKSPNDPGIITVEDIKGAIKKQKIDPIKPGDVVIFNTGHGQYWGKDWDSLSPEQKAKNKEIFNSGEPGPAFTACRYLSSLKIAMVGSDAWGTEALPGENVNRPLDCHIEWMVKNGITNIENLDVSQLLEDKVYEFMFVFAPLKMKGATGSPGNPIAIY